jgi:hypothetical protein
MKRLVRIITLLAVGSLPDPGFCVAQNTVEDEVLRRTTKALAQVQEKAQFSQQKAQAAMKKADRELRLQDEALRKAEVAMKEAQSQLRLRLAGALSRSGAGTVLTVPTAETKPEELTKMVEDMAVMSRIFDKALTREHLADGADIPLLGEGRNLRRFYADRAGTIASLCIQGYGALFMVDVDFPLSPAPQVQEDPNEERADQLWKETQREIYAPERAMRLEKQEQPETYDAKKVEDLKQTLIETLRHAANIRTLKPDESVIVTVGTSSQPGSRLSIYYLYQNMPDAGRLTIGQERYLPSRTFPAARSSLFAQPRN